MPAPCAHPLSMVLKREVARFLTSAAPTSRPLYRNRRAAARYHRALPIFVYRLDKGRAFDVGATLQDISDDGIGFHCDEEFPLGAILGIKLFWSEPNAPRIPVIVRHWHVTQEGILIGAHFALNDAVACTLLEAGSRTWYG